MKEGKIERQEKVKEERNDCHGECAWLALCSSLCVYVLTHRHLDTILCSHHMWYSTYQDYS